MRKVWLSRGFIFTAVLAIALLVSSGSSSPILADAPDTSSDNPPVVGPTPASPAVPQGPNPLGSGKVYYSDANSVGPTTPFYEYDVATDTWAQRAAIPDANTTQLASDEIGNVYSLAEDGNIRRYNPGADTWDFVMNGPAASVGRNAVSMFEAHNGEFYWERDGTNTLYYTVGGVWNSITTPRFMSSGAGTDRSTGRIYIRTYTELGFFAFDPASATFPQVCDFGGDIDENSRVGAFYDGEFFSRSGSGTYQAIDVSTCAVRETGVAPTSNHSSTGEDQVGNIYSNGWDDDIVFEVFNVLANTLTRLADAPDIPGNAHSTLVAVGGEQLPKVTVRAGSGTAAPGEQVTIPVDAFLNPPSIVQGSFTVEVKYDTQLLTGVGCDANPAGVFDFGNCSPNYAPGVARCTGISSLGVSGPELRLCDLTFGVDPDAPFGETTPLVVNCVVKTDPDGIPILCNEEAGLITFGKQGDVNCDNLVNVVDALFILQYEVGLRVDGGGCPLPPPPHDLLNAAGGDVDKDGVTNVVDALFILQCEVGAKPGANMPFCTD